MIMYISFAIMAASTLFWLYFLSIRPILNIFQQAKTYEILKRSGKRVEAAIVSRHLLKEISPTQQLLSIKVTFDNLVGTPIFEHFEITDTETYLNRYAIGKRIYLLLVEKSFQGRQVLLEGGKTQINLPYITFFVFLFIVLCSLLYSFLILPLWKASEENWRQFLQFFDSSATETIPLFSLMLIIVFFVCRFMSKLPPTAKSVLLYKYCGKQATAIITNYKSIGTRINNNPVIEFTFNFTTEKGVLVSVKDRKMVDQLDLHKLPDYTKTTIIYLTEAPEKAKLLENLEGYSDPTSIFNFIWLSAYFFCYLFLCAEFVGTFT